MRNAHKSLIRTRERKRPYEMPWHKMEDNCAMDIIKCG
jgi:hypothetical protein